MKKTDTTTALTTTGQLFVVVVEIKLNRIMKMTKETKERGKGVKKDIAFSAGIEKPFILVVLLFYSYTLGAADEPRRCKCAPGMDRFEKLKFSLYTTYEEIHNCVDTKACW